VEESTVKKDYMQSSLINPLLCEMRENVVFIFMPISAETGVANLRTVSVAPNTLQIVFSSTMFPTLDSSATALAAACLLMTCLPQKHLAASSAIKV